MYSNPPEVIGRINGNENEITVARISKQYNYIIIGDSEGNCYIYDTKSLMCIHYFQVYERVVSIYINEENGNMIIATSKQFSYYDINGDLIASSSIFDDYSSVTIAVLCQTPLWYDGQYAITCHSHGTINFWKLNQDEMQLIGTNEKVKTEDVITNIALLDNNKTIVVVYSNGKVVSIS